VPRYRLDRVDVEPLDSRPATWTFAQATVTGVERRYAVTDWNHTIRNRWEFVVRLPKTRRERIEVRPVRVPNDRAFAGLDRRSITFSRATRPGFAGLRYCQLSLAVPPGQGTRDVVHRGEAGNLPYWLRNLGWRIKLKATVRSTRGTDAHSLVLLVREADHAMMIRLFFATKAWVLKRRFWM